jgi:hypothetical protein
VIDLIGECSAWKVLKQSQLGELVMEMLQLLQMVYGEQIIPVEGV